jgi:hypothetical protein
MASGVPASATTRACEGPQETKRCTSMVRPVMCGVSRDALPARVADDDELESGIRQLSHYACVFVPRVLCSCADNLACAASLLTAVAI